MICDQDLQTQSLCLRNALDAGNAIVDGNEHISPRLLHTLCNGGRQTIAIHNAIGHDVAHLLRAQHAQTPKADCTGCCAVAIVVGHDAKSLVACNGIGQQNSCRLVPFQGVRRQ